MNTIYVNASFELDLCLFFVIGLYVDKVIDPICVNSILYLYKIV